MHVLAHVLDWKRASPKSAGVICVMHAHTLNLLAVRYGWYDGYRCYASFRYHTILVEITQGYC